jgi:hypothetical protein
MVTRKEWRLSVVQYALMELWTVLLKIAIAMMDGLVLLVILV